MNPKPYTLSRLNPNTQAATKRLRSPVDSCNRTYLLTVGPCNSTVQDPKTHNAKPKPCTVQSSSTEFLKPLFLNHASEELHTPHTLTDPKPPGSRKMCFFFCSARSRKKFFFLLGPPRAEQKKKKRAPCFFFAWPAAHGAKKKTRPLFQPTHSRGRASE